MKLEKILAGFVIAAGFAAGSASAAEGPFNAAQLETGKKEYNTHCRTCHGANGKGALGPALFGDPFKKRFGGQTVTDVRTWTYENMPQTAPKSLTDAQLDPIIAYILSLNGFTPGQAELTAESGKSVQIPQ